MRTNLIVRTDLISDPGKFGVDLGKAPRSQILIYENNGVLPKCITLGGDGQGDPRKGYYAPVVLEMIQNIKFLQRDHKYPGIKEIMDKKYRRVFEIMDVVELWRLRYLTMDLIQGYLERSSLTRPQKAFIANLFSRKLTYKMVKKEILALLARINIKSEAK